MLQFTYKFVSSVVNGVVAAICHRLPGNKTIKHQLFVALRIPVITLPTPTRVESQALLSFSKREKHDGRVGEGWICANHHDLPMAAAVTLKSVSRLEAT